MPSSQIGNTARNLVSGANEPSLPLTRHYSDGILGQLLPMRSLRASYGINSWAVEMLHYPHNMKASSKLEDGLRLFPLVAIRRRLMSCYG
jgi:hypothetical protein